MPMFLNITYSVTSCSVSICTTTFSCSFILSFVISLNHGVMITFTAWKHEIINCLNLLHLYNTVVFNCTLFFIILWHVLLTSWPGHPWKDILVSVAFIWLNKGDCWSMRRWINTYNFSTKTTFLNVEQTQESPWPEDTSDGGPWFESWWGSERRPCLWQHHLSGLQCSLLGLYNRLLAGAAPCSVLQLLSVWRRLKTASRHHADLWVCRDLTDMFLDERFCSKTHPKGLLTNQN